MTSPGIQNWISDASEKNAQRRTVYSLIFGMGGFAYFLYRTRLQIANLVMRLGLHIFEYFLVFHTMPSFLLTMMMMRIVVIAIESGWWGILDAMRQRIRTLKDKNDFSAIRNEIEDWLAIAQRMALLVLFVGLTATVLFSSSASQAILIAALSTQLAVRLLLRTLYSGAYAIQRIYVRFDWIIGAEISVFLLAWMMKPVLGHWTMTVCIVAAGILSSYISYYFIRHALAFVRITPRLLIAPLNMKRLKSDYAFAHLWAPGLAMISIRLHDILLILAIQFLYHDPKRAGGLLFVFYLIIPAVRTAMSWAQILYFDMVRSQLDAFKGLRSYFERIGFFYATLYGIVIAFLAQGALALSLPESKPYLHLIFIYIVLCSMLGLVHISLFTRKQYSSLVTVALIQYVALFALMHAQFPLEAAFAISISVPLLVGIALIVRSTVRQEDAEHKYLQWIRYVGEQKDGQQLIVVEFFIDVSMPFRRYFAEQLGAMMGKNMTYSFYKDYLLAVLPRSDMMDKQKADHLLTLGAGHIEHIHTYEVANGDEIIRKLADMHGLRHIASQRSLQQLSQAFRAIFPSGEVQIPTRKNPKLFTQLLNEDLHAIVNNALSYAEGKKRSSDTTWYVTTTQHGGLIEAMFLVRRAEVTPEKRDSWIKIVEDKQAPAGDV